MVLQKINFKIYHLVIESLTIFSSCNSSHRTIAAILILTSSNLVAFISFDRCLHLVKLNNYKMTCKRLFVGILCSWLPPLLTPTLRLLKDRELLYSVAFNVELFGSLIVVMFFYLVIVLSLRRHAHQHSSLVQQSYVNNQKRATRTVAVILLFYILMNLPITVNRALVIVGGMSEDFVAKSYVIGSVLFVNSSVVNPLVYCLQTPSLRRKFLALFVCGNVRNDRPHHDTTFTVTPSDPVPPSPSLSNTVRPVNISSSETNF